MTKDEKIAKVKEILDKYRIYVSDNDVFIGEVIETPYLTGMVSSSHQEYFIKISVQLLNDLAELIND